jgi:hypothetical protein
MWSCPNIFVSSTDQQMPLESSIVVQKFFNFDWRLNSCFIGLCSDCGSHCRIFWCFSWFHHPFQANDGIVFQNRPWQLSSDPSQVLVRIYPPIRRLNYLRSWECVVTWAAQKGGWAFRCDTYCIYVTSEHSNLVSEFRESRYVPDGRRDAMNHSLQRFKLYERELK